MLAIKCALCSIAITQDAVCSDCQKTIQQNRLIIGCQRCAHPNVIPICGECLQTPPHFDRLIAPYIYHPPINHLIKQFKYGSGWQLAQFLAKLLPTLPENDNIIPIPLHPIRERQRGFNQAREIIKQLNKKPNNTLLNRVENTPPQAGITDPTLRRKNVSGAFRVNGKIDNQTILLVDDIMTTGATLNEAAKTLKKAGAKQVICLVIARATKNK